jgi:hypothetical protein
LALVIRSKKTLGFWPEKVEAPQLICGAFYLNTKNAINLYLKIALLIRITAGASVKRKRHLCLNMEQVFRLA